MVQISATEKDAALTRRRRRSTAKDEEQSPFTYRGQGRPAREIGQKRPKRARFATKPDFNSPAAAVGRPASATGAVSFHFSFTPVTKQAGLPGCASVGAGHARYIERIGAPEQLGAQHSDYLVRDGAVERTPGVGWLDADTGQAATGFANGRNLSCGTSLIFTNIHADATGRADYWDAVERCERTPGKSRIKFDASALFAWELPAAELERMPPILRGHFAKGARPDRNGNLQFEPLAVSAEETAAIMRWVETTTGWQPEASPLQYAAARGGRIQYRIIAELPAELDSAGRGEIVRRFAASFGARGLMYTAVVHAPDPQGDARNFHLHLDFHDRPARYLDDHACWDFEFNVPSTDRHRNTRTQFPCRQKKVQAVAQTRDAVGGFVGLCRGEFATISNAVLAEHGRPKRYDPRSFAAMGIDRLPSRHLGSAATSLERRGVPTAVGNVNSTRYWDRLEERLAQTSDDAFHTAMLPYHRLLAHAQTSEADHIRTVAFKYGLAKQTEFQLQYELDLAELLEQKARSRAVMVAGASGNLIAAIDAGRMDPSTSTTRPAVEERRREADRHLTVLADEFASYGTLFAQMRRDRAAFAAAAASRKAVLDARLRGPAIVSHEVERLVHTSAAEVSAAGADRTGLVPARSDHGVTPAVPVATSFKPFPVGEIVAYAELSPAAHIPSPVTSNVQVVLPAVTPQQGTSNERDRGPYGSTAYGLDATPADRARLAGRRAEGTDAERRDGLLDLSPLDVDAGLPGLERGAASSGMEGRASTLLLQPPAQLHVPRKPDPDAPLWRSRDGVGATGSRAFGAVDVGVSPAPLADEGSLKPAMLTATASVSHRDDAPSLLRAEIPHLENAPVTKRARNPSFTTLDTPEPTLRSRWSAVIDRIIEERMVLVEDECEGIQRLSCPDLVAADKALLETTMLAEQTRTRLAKHLEHQRREIGRLIAWINTVISDPAAYKLENRVLRFERAPKAIETLLKRYGQHPALSPIRKELASSCRARELPKVSGNAATQARPVFEANRGNAGIRDVRTARRSPPATECFPTLVETPRRNSGWER